MAGRGNHDRGRIKSSAAGINHAEGGSGISGEALKSYLFFYYLWLV